MIFFVHDFISVNGYINNGINPSMYPHFFDTSFKSDKESTEKVYNKENGYLLTSGENYFQKFIRHRNIHIDVLSKYADSSNVFYYPINTMARTEEFFGGNKFEGKSVFDFISHKTIQSLKKYENFKILIYVGLESEMPYRYFSHIYIALQNNNINPNKVIIVSNHYKNYENNKTYLEKLNLDTSKSLTFYFFDEFLRNKGNELLDDKNKKIFLKEESIIQKKKFKSLMLNRRLHLHRRMFLSLIGYENLLDENLISFDFEFNKDLLKKDDLKESLEQNKYISADMFYDLAQYPFDEFTPKDKHKILLGYDKIQKINKLDLDVTDFQSISGRELEVDDTNLYKSTYFSLVAETEFFDRWNSRTTEKILKPIQQYHPFVLLGPHHGLQNLRNLGFKTFDSVWDESYDNEPSASKRMMKVFVVFKELCDKTNEEWLQILKQIKPILIHNREQLKKFSYKNEQTITNNFKKFLSNEYFSKNKKLLQKT